MGFNESLILIIIDKLLIGAIFLIAGFWLKGRLEKLKGQLALQSALAPARASAFGALWKLTQPLTPRARQLPTIQECADAFLELRKWYYAENGAMHLSLDASDLCLKLLAALENQDGKAAKKLTSGLRTQLKVDLGVYTRGQGRVSLPRGN
jgi:hypothetical protein